jgi:hypothetical protein
MRPIRQHLTYANVMATIAVFIALGGGTAVALTGSNTVQSDDLGPGSQVTAPDVAANAVNGSDVLNNSIASADITNGTVSVLDTRQTIPSGATVTGVLVGKEDDSAGPSPVANLLITADFYGLRAPTSLTDADINFDDIGLSAAAAVDGDPSTGGEESTGCTGTIDTPTAPAGKVCIYLSDEVVTDGTADALNLGAGTEFPATMNDRGFKVLADEASFAIASLHGTWAYRAP